MANNVTRCLLFTSFFLLTAPTQAATVSVYGAEQGRNLTLSHHTDHQYIIQMGSFKNKQYATEFQARLAQKTNQTVHLVCHEDASVPYAVFLGPFNDVKTVNQTSRELLGEQKVLRRAQIFSSILAPKKNIKRIKKNAPIFKKNDGVHSRFVTLNVGPVWENAGETQAFYLTPDIEKNFSANTSSHALVDGELFLGIQKPLREKLDGQIGLAVATTGNAALSGNIWDDADPQFNNAKYNYKIKHTHLAIKGKLLSDRGYLAIPWLSGSVGVGFNQAHSFSNTVTQAGAIAMPNFASNTTTAFTYTVGAGIERHLSEHWLAGMGYEFADWGKSQLDRASYQLLNTGLTLNHLYTNGFLLNLTYLA
ncbi:MAG: SPOR domain-containing protein [Legionellaceae bacterium]|nr:SPOR domain-containing protein [Legionellaceae bacterium]